VLVAEILRLESEDGRKIDLGFVGEVAEVNGQLLLTLCRSGTIPVIAPVALDRTGEKLNVNADTAAGMVAAAVQAEKLVVVSDTHGILSDLKDPKSTISTVHQSDIKGMMESGIIGGAMMPKVEACITALNGGTRKAHIIDGRIEHSLLLEIYTQKGIGTEIIKNNTNQKQG
jgi:acetylglutamate kinase